VCEFRVGVDLREEEEQGLDCGGGIWEGVMVRFWILDDLAEVVDEGDGESMGCLDCLFGSRV